MDLFPNDMQEEMLGTVRAMLRAELPVSATRWSAEGSAADARALAIFAELGWYALALPEDQGGVGFTPAEEVLLVIEAARFLAPIGLIAGMLGARLAAGISAADMVSGIASGAMRVAFALPGTPARLVAATGSDLLLAVTDDGAHLLPASAASARILVPSLDGTLTIETATLELGAALVTGDLARHRDLLAAAYLTGMAEQAMALAIEHACTREQFGQPIGAFQGVKHPCADMAVRCEAAHWQTSLAALAIDGPDRDYQVAAALLLARDAAFANCAASIQIHGGMGFTAECPVHFFLKRAHVIDRIVGGRHRIGEAMLAAPAPELTRRVERLAV
jgi:alkylation response protein AidB-like acyl-CoA dehydrogenase